MLPTAVYGLDIGVYETGTTGQVLARTTAAWCRLTEGIPSFDALAYAGNPSRGTFESALETTGATVFSCGRSLVGLAELMAADISDGMRVALGFEAPMWFPVEREHGARLNLFAPRFAAESGHAWYLQSGAAASLKAVSLAVLLFATIRSSCGREISWTTCVERWQQDRLILYEAFVAGDYKVTAPSVASEAPDEWDALTAALAWGALHAEFAVPNGFNAVAVHEAGRRAGPSTSMWCAIDGEVEIHGPPDCEVVALARGD